MRRSGERGANKASALSSRPSKCAKTPFATACPSAKSDCLPTWRAAVDCSTRRTILRSLLADFRAADVIPTDATTGSLIWSNAQLAGWVEVDILPMLTAGKSLKRLQVWGYSGGGVPTDIARFDDFLFCY